MTSTVNMARCSVVEAVSAVVCFDIPVSASRAVGFVCGSRPDASAVSLARWRSVGARPRRSPSVRFRISGAAAVYY